MNKNLLIRVCSCMCLIGLLGVMMTGCGMFHNVQSEETAEDVNSDLIVVGFSQLGSESVWRTAHTASIQNALTKDKGYFLIYSNARQKQENQIKAIRSFISQRVDYLVFSPAMEEGWDTVLQEAKDAGIPVILVDRMVSVEDDSLYTTWIGADAEQEGKNAGLWLEEEFPHNEDINIVVLEGTEGSSITMGRTAGFASIAEKHPNWHILESLSGDFTTTKGNEVMKYFIKRYQDIDVVLSQNDDMTFGAVEALKDAGISVGVNGDVKIISFDAVGDALKMVDDGIINVDVECNPEQGKYVAEIIQRLEQHEQVQKAYPVEEKVFTKDNVEEYLNDRTY